MAGRIRWLLALLRRADPRGAAPSGWALALDAAVAVGAAAGAVYETTTQTFPQHLTKQALAQGLTKQALAQALLPLLRQGKLELVGPAHASAWLLAGAALTALPLAWRRLSPITAWLVIIAAVVAVHNAYVPTVALGTAMYAAYSAFVHSRYRNLAIAVVTVTTVVTAGEIGGTLPRFPARVTAIFAVLAATLAGLGIRELRRRLADSTTRLSRAAEEARVATERALAAERSRIASELHDVVTHNVSVMVVQAGAARKIMSSSPADAEDALLAVEATGREAMTELRILLGLLAPPADGAGDDARFPGAAATGTAPDAAPGPGVAPGPGSGPAPGASPVPNADRVPADLVSEAGPGSGRTAAALRPQPRLDELGSLIGRVSAAGLPVELAVSGSPRPLPPGADLAAYRVVQEGLTNVLRHAGPPAEPEPDTAGTGATVTAKVAVDWTDDLVITVTDTGGLAGAGTRDAQPGRGLLGLRERLALYGGELSAGPRPDGGWSLQAILPLAPAAPGSTAAPPAAPGPPTAGSAASQPAVPSPAAREPATGEANAPRPDTPTPATPPAAPRTNAPGMAEAAAAETAAAGATG